MKNCHVLILIVFLFINSFAKNTIVNCSVNPPSPIFSYTQEEIDFLDAVKFFKDNSSSVTSIVFNNIKTKFNSFITKYPASNLIDDAGIAILAAAVKTNDWNIFLNEYNNREIKGNLSYLLFTDSDCRAFIPSFHSTLTKSELFVIFYKAQIQSSKTLLPSKYDIQGAITDFKKVVELSPESSLASASQYHIATLKELLYKEGTENIDNVITEYRKLFNNYIKYDKYYTGLGIARAASLAVLYGHSSFLTEMKELIETNYSRNNYLTECSFIDGSFKKWVKSSLTVYITRTDSAITNTDIDLVKEAAGKIETVLNKKLQFYYTNTESLADIKIYYSKNNGNYSQIYSTKRTNSADEITSAAVYLKTSNTFNERKIRTLHELIHTIGLDHSFNNTDVMFFSGNTSGELSQRDIATMQGLYTESNFSPIVSSAINNFYSLPDSKIYFDIDAFHPFYITGYELLNNTDWLKIDQSSGLLESTKHPLPAGSYSVKVKINSSNSYSNSFNITLTISSTLTDIESIKNTKTKTISIYPNPGHDFFEIDGLDNKINYTLIIYDLIGRVVTVENLNNGRNRINISGLASGNYFVKITGDKYFFYGRVTKLK